VVTRRCLHVFAEEALVVTCLAARPSEGKGRAHWVREAGLLADFEYLAQVRYSGLLDKILVTRSVETV